MEEDGKCEGETEEDRERYMEAETRASERARESEREIHRERLNPRGTLIDVLPGQHTALPVSEPRPVKPRPGGVHCHLSLRREARR